MNLKRTLAALVAFMALAVVGACGWGDQQVSYQPAAYGQQVQLQPGQTYQQATPGGFQNVAVQQQQDSWVCWIASDYHEAALLAASGACPNAWVPILMASLSQGLYWHEMYAPYFDSYGYYGRYVPAPYRQTYISNVTVFETHYHTQIVQAETSSAAKWKGSDGKPYTGQTVSKYVQSGKASFGSGNIRSQGYSGGNQNAVGATARPAATAAAVQPSQTTRTSAQVNSAASTQASSRWSQGSSSSGFSSGQRSSSSGAMPGSSGRR